MRVLVASIDGASRSTLALRLAGAGIPFDSASYEEAPDFLRCYDYDVLLLAVDEPRPALARLRRAGITLPVLAVAAGDGPSRAALLDLGADDAVTPGCDSTELVARLRAIVRRNRGHAASDLRAGAAELRLGRMEVLVHGRPVPLTPKEYAILELLFLRRGVVHSKNSIVNHVYGAEEGPALRTLDVIVCKLRKKLAAGGAPDLVATVWGSGLTLHDVPAEFVTAEAGEPELVPA